MSPGDRPVTYGDKNPYEGVTDEWTWARHDLADDWVVAFRISVQNGEHVVGELRVYPREPGEEGRRLPGWSEEGDAIPLGGITTRLVRKVRVGAALAAAQGAIEASAHVLPPELQPKGKAAHRPRRRKRDDALLARVAVRYGEAREAGSGKASRSTHERLRDIDSLYYSPESVRQLVYAARRRGFLPPTRKGSGTGRASDEARAIYEAEEAKAGHAKRGPCRLTEPELLP